LWFSRHAASEKQNRKETVALGQNFETSEPVWLLVESKLLPSAVGESTFFSENENN
jgi:hypothetical protein